MRIGRERKGTHFLSRSWLVTYNHVDCGFYKSHLDLMLGSTSLHMSSQSSYVSA